MKKTLFVVVMCAFSTISFAQLDLGLKLGFNSSRLTLDNISQAPDVAKNYNMGDLKDDMSNGFNIGAFARLGLTESLFFQPEVYYSVKKGSTSFNVQESVKQETFVVDQDLDLKTFDVPLLLGYKILDLKIARLSAFTGPVLSFNTGGKVKFNSTGVINDVDLGDISTSDLKKSTWAYQLGVGLDAAMFTFDVRYEWGLSNLWEIESVKNIDFTQKNKMLTFSLGFKIF